jgi:hypothetical protein
MKKPPVPTRQVKGFSRAAISGNIRRYYHHGPSKGPLKGRPLPVKQAVAISLSIAERAARSKREVSAQARRVLASARRYRMARERKNP